MKQLKKFALICIALVGFTLITQAAVNALTPQPEILSATNILESETNNNGGIVDLVVEFSNTEYLELFEIINNIPSNYQGIFCVEYLSEKSSVTIRISNLTPGLHTFIVLASSSEDPIGTWSKPFTVYVNEPQN